jgi:hypothetical protein
MFGTVTVVSSGKGSDDFYSDLRHAKDKFCKGRES